MGSDEARPGRPAPDTVSPRLRALIDAPPRKGWNLRPESAEAWAPFVAAAADAVARLPALKRRLRVEAERVDLDGARGFLVTPETVAPANRERLLLHVHGGCYMLNPGEAGLPEAMLMATFGGFRVLSVDYRMPPEAFFPAALDDVMTAWKWALERQVPARMAVFGTSAGGALTLALTLRAKAEGLALPGALGVGTPMSDVTKRGDTFLTLEGIDNVLVSKDGFCDAATLFYANGHDLADPWLSPVYGEFAGFPPTVLTTGTRDLLLSNTVRVHRKLRQSGVETALNVYEGQAHAQYLFDDQAPETREVFEEIAGFFDQHLAR